MKALGVITAIICALAPVVVQADTTRTYRCQLHHFQRAGGTELRSSGINFMNVDPVESAIVRRLTIVNHSGALTLLDTGPDSPGAVPHPLNTDFPPPTDDFTIIPPGNNNYIVTTQIWGVSNPTVNFDDGVAMSAIVVVSKPGAPHLLDVSAGARVRMLANPAGPQTNEIARSNLPCVLVR